MSTYQDYRYRFRLAQIATALGVLPALRTAGLLGGDMPANMLGDPLDATGTVTSSPVFFGRVADGWVYLHVRSSAPPGLLPDVASFGLEAVSAEASAAILGVWA